MILRVLYEAMCYKVANLDLELKVVYKM